VSDGATEAGPFGTLEEALAEVAERAENSGTFMAYELEDRNRE